MELASRFSCGGRRWWLLHFRHLHKAEAQFRERVVEQPLLFPIRVALGLFLEHRHGIDGMARDTEIRFARLLLWIFGKADQPERGFRLRLKRNDQKFKCWR